MKEQTKTATIYKIVTNALPRQVGAVLRDMKYAPPKFGITAYYDSPNGLMFDVGEYIKSLMLGYHQHFANEGLRVDKPRAIIVADPRVQGDKHRTSPTVLEDLLSECREISRRLREGNYQARLNYQAHLIEETTMTDPDGVKRDYKWRTVPINLNKKHDRK